ncbi:MAG: TIM barrel protein [Dehalococcoidales bacterium]|nr:MAG: TIM barrel protein [Dehalococcoidales bacterium]UCB42759.1 MAG: TIM barrel protein [Dehalococcoidales bacterium]
MTGLLFGTAGTPHSTKKPSTASGIERVSELGLGCMEMEFVRRASMGETTTRVVAETAARTGVKLTAHAPYYINLNAREPEKVRASQERILQTARIASWCGAHSVAFHAAFYLGDPPEQTYRTVKKQLEEVLEQLSQENIKVWIRPELMGRGTQFGSLEELLDLSLELEMVAPCIDFAHYHARDGKNNSYDEFSSILSRVEERLGRDALDDIHIHVSGIAYGKKGEIKHLNMHESDFQYIEFIRALKDYDVKGMVVCESPNLEDDALLLQNTYHDLLGPA